MRFLASPARVLMVIMATAAVLLAATVATSPLSARTAAPATFTPGADWRDDDGELIEAHSGGMFVENGTYYWIGQSWTDGDNSFEAINCYASTDLQNWQFVNAILTPSVQLPASDIVARPKIIYNGQADRYVLWAKYRTESEPEPTMRVVVATSTSVCGDYQYQDKFYLGADEHLSGDIAVYEESAGQAYLVTSSVGTRTTGNTGRRIKIFALTSNHQDVADHPVYTSAADHREAPVLLKRGGLYYLITSGTSGWTPNQSAYSTATSIAGPWSPLQNLGDQTTFDSQPSFVIQVDGSQATTLVYAGGRHIGASLEDSRYVWLPLTLTGTTPSLDWHDNWTLDTQTGQWQDNGGAGSPDEAESPANALI